VVRQVLRGRSKAEAPPKPKLALQASQVAGLIKKAEEIGDIEMACLIAVSRLYLLRVPSEGIPLSWNGQHSSVQVDGGLATITLTRRKPNRRPSVLVRHCCCQTAGRRLCAVHWLLRLQGVGRTGRLFHLSANQFLVRLRSLAVEVGIPLADQLGTHALRRGMARDIVDAGGSLATLLRAGEWGRFCRIPA
jgi:hypothetical protein